MLVLSRPINTIIVGGGHAGINLACMLTIDQPETSYLVLERSSSLLSKWRNARWEGFNLNTPAKMSLLYGETLAEGSDPWKLERSMESELERWDAHIGKLGIKHKLNANVLEVAKTPGRDTITVRVEEKGPDSSKVETYEARNVAVCNGYYDAPSLPKALSDSIAQHAGDVKQHVPAGLQWDELKDGNVLLVGSGQTGVQIADLLLRHRPDKRLYMATSSVPGVPRNFQGRDLFDWLEEMKFLDMPRSALDAVPPEKFQAMRYGKAPVTGPTKDISPFSLHRRGVELFGHLKEVVSERDGGAAFHFVDDRASNLKTAHEGYCNFANAIKKHAGQPDAPDAPEWSNLEPELLDTPGRLEIDIVEENITNIIWCTGWSKDFGFLSKVDGIEKDMDGKTSAPDLIVSKALPGLFYCGFPWIGTLQSMNLVRFNHDAKVIVDNLRKD